MCFPRPRTGPHVFFRIFIYFFIGTGSWQLFELRDFQTGKGGELFKRKVLLPQLPASAFLAGLSPAF